jgi:site-specific DNA-cytosine methylase
MNVISVCSGYGGLDMGIQRVFHEADVLAYSDIEAFPCANLVSKMEKGLIHPAPIWTNLLTFPYEDFRDRVDLFAAGFPCQPFSQMSVDRQTTEDDRFFFPELMGALKTMNYPSLVLFENVEGILRDGEKGIQKDTKYEKQGQAPLYYCLREMERNGYHMASGLFNCIEVGASMPRHRVYMLGIHKKITPHVQETIVRTLSEQPRILADKVESLMDSQGDNFGFNQTQEQMLAQRQSAVDFKSNIYEMPTLMEVFSGGEAYSKPIRTAFPSYKNEAQHAWEAPRFVRMMNDGGLDKQTSIDEMHLLGNGVVPAQAEFALRYLLADLWNTLKVGR